MHMYLFLVITAQVCYIYIYPTAILCIYILHVPFLSFFSPKVLEVVYASFDIILACADLIHIPACTSTTYAFPHTLPPPIGQAKGR